MNRVGCHGESTSVHPHTQILFWTNPSTEKIKEMERAPNTSTTPSIPTTPPPLPPIPPQTPTMDPPFPHPHLVQGPPPPPKSQRLTIPTKLLDAAVAGDLGPGSAALGPKMAARGHSGPPSPSKSKVRCTVPLRNKLAHNARSHARPCTCSTPIRFTPNARSRMHTFHLYAIARVRRKLRRISRLRRRQ